MVGCKQGHGQQKKTARVNNFVKHNNAKKTKSGNGNDFIDGTLPFPSPAIANTFTDNNASLPEVEAGISARGEIGNTNSIAASSQIVDNYIINGSFKDSNCTTSSSVQHQKVWAT